MRVAVILGGPSAEREVSLHTGENIVAALRQKGYEAMPLDVTDDLSLRLCALAPDVVYIALHGRFGEDGCVQGLLEILGIPYVGSGVLASALGMNKLMSRRLFAAAGLPCPHYQVVEQGELAAKGVPEIAQRLLDAFGLPLVVKPNSQGSAIGVTVVREGDALPGALETALALDTTALIEEYIAGPEITVAILGDRPPEALPVIEIVPKKPFYDYDAKYTPGMSEHIIPARLSAETARLAQEYALRAYTALGCRHFARVDLLVNASTGLPVVLEVNTLPGMTATSLVPDAARAVGIEFPDLVERLVLMAAGRRD
ncbi:MAG TPA: D-alanine--D-alanine ligase [Firmicutes bacterium]|nr:D-alanine--D-alanine ligase [Bacillota bacterium]